MKTRPVHIFLVLIAIFVAVPIIVMFASTTGKAFDNIRNRAGQPELATDTVLPDVGHPTEVPLTTIEVNPARATDEPMIKSLPELPPAEIGIPALDMALTARVDKPQANVGDQVVYYFTITNFGTETIPAATFTNDLPAELGAIDATIDRGTIKVEGQTITAELGTMAPGDKAEVTVTTKVNSVPTLAPEVTTIGVLSVDSPSDDTSNNVALIQLAVGSDTPAASLPSLTTETQPAANIPAPALPSTDPFASPLSMTIQPEATTSLPQTTSQPVSVGNVLVTESSNLNQANIGDAVIFTLDVSNPTKEIAPAVILEKEVPGTFQIIDVQAEKGTVQIEGNLVRIDIGDMPANSDNQITITTQIQSTALLGTLAETNTLVETVPSVSTDAKPIVTNIPSAVEVKAPADLPATGFAPNRVTDIVGPSFSKNTDYNMVLTIPVIGMQTGVWGISQYEGGWDLRYLFNLAGHLEGTVMPGTTGNSVLTGHVTNADGQPGIFNKLDQLIAGDAIYVHANGKTSKYSVVSVGLADAKDGQKIFKPSNETVITLITCAGFDEATGTFGQRVVVTAKLVK